MTKEKNSLRHEVELLTEAVRKLEVSLGVEQSPPFERINSGQQEHWTGIAYPQEGHQADWSSCFTQIEWSWIEVVFSHNQPCKDWHSIATHPPYCAYGNDGCEDDVKFQNG